jgi:hypothetical protein
MDTPQKKVDLKDSPALAAYAKWRPRLRRAASWAFPAAAVGKAVGVATNPIIGLTIGAGLAGAADATLEEKLRQLKDHKARTLVQRGFEETHMGKKAGIDVDPFTTSAITAAELETNLALTGLTRKRDEFASRASSQLSDYFPAAGGQVSGYGRGLRLSTGQGSIAQMLAGLR